MPEEGAYRIVSPALVFAVQLSYLGRAVRSKVNLANHLGVMTMGLVGMEIVQRRQSFARGVMKGEKASKLTEMKMSPWRRRDILVCLEG